MWAAGREGLAAERAPYGMLQGLDKTEVAEHYGAEQVKEWRRGFSVSPPASIPPTRATPGSTGATAVCRRLPARDRVAGEDDAAACWRCGTNASCRGCACASASSSSPTATTLRALIKHLEGIPDEEISS